jgi:penicillin-binding protein 2
MAQAIATIANDGVMYRPHLVNYITDSKTGEKTLIETQPLRTLPWKPQNIEFIKKAMIGVNKEGTGARAFAGAEYESGGKTGTAQLFSLKGADYRGGKLKQELRDHALFIAFAPADHPKIALAVLVENGGFGAQSAAPIARMVIDYYLLGKQPKGPAQDDETRRTRRNSACSSNCSIALRARLVDHIDGPLLTIALALMAFGLATVYSATYDANNRA